MTMIDGHPVAVTLYERIQTYSAAFQTSEQFHNGWQSVLKAAYGRADLSCGCRGPGLKRLAVKYYEGADIFSLARFSLTGGEHSPDCQFYSASPTQVGQVGVLQASLISNLTGRSRFVWKSASSSAALRRHRTDLLESRAVAHCRPSSLQ
jgi:hypothetical protein